MDNPFDWDYLRTVPGTNEVFGPFSIAYLVLFLIGLALSIVVYNGWAKKRFTDPVTHRMARKWAGIAIVIFGLGLFFFLIRWLQINPFGFGRRYWLWLTLVALLGLAIYAVWDFRTHYTALRAQYDEKQLRRSYARGTHTGSTASERGKQLATTPQAPRPRPVVKKRRKA